MPLTKRQIWILPGLRTPFTKVDGALAELDAIAMSIPVARTMMDQVQSGRVDLTVWGTVAPNLTWSNIAREVFMDAELDPSVPAYSTVLACATGAAAALEGAAMLGHGNGDLALCGGVESMSRVQLGISQGLSDWLRRLAQARSMKDRLALMAEVSLKDIRLYIPSVANRTTKKSMGQHAEEMAKEWNIERSAQDELALASHRNAVDGYEKGFFSDLVMEVGGTAKDGFPRPDTSIEKLAKLRPAFDKQAGSITAGNASPLTDGAAGVWVASNAGVKRLASDLPKVRLVDWELAAVDIRSEGLLMAPAYAIPRLLARQDLDYEKIDLWEIHEAFAAQVLCNIAALESELFLSQKAKVTAKLGAFPRERVNPNGGSVALGHPFGATGGRMLSQAAKELAAMPSGSRGIVSICADGGLGAVVLLENP